VPVAKWQERKTSGYLGLEFTFMQMPGSGSDPQLILVDIFTNTQINMIGNTKGTVGIPVPVIALLEVNFACLYQGRELFE